MAKKGKILIADKNRHVRDFLQREFISEGYRVEVARDGQEVWHFLNSQEPPDLLILDPSRVLVCRIVGQYDS